MALDAEKYGSWTVLSRAPRRNRIGHWVCRCVCGEERDVSEPHLKSGKSTSCGCSRRQMEKTPCSVPECGNTSRNRTRIGPLCALHYQRFLARGMTSPTRTPPKRNLTGMRFGRLAIVGPAPGRRGKNLCWNCLCDCGVNIVVVTGSLTSGNTKSCGCLARDTKSRLSTRHGKASTPEYRAWMNMKSRCENANTPLFHRYGGRGIRVLYSSFEHFLADVGPRPSPEHSIDRLENDLHYEPGNCKWRTDKEQANNTSRNQLIGFGGIIMTVAQWADHVGLKENTLRYRLLRKWPVDCALLVPHEAERESRMSHKRNRDSVKARRICFDAHKWLNHLGHVRLTCHYCKLPIDPIKDRWRADHIHRFAEGGQDTAENLFPIHERCDADHKAPNDVREIAKGKRVRDRHYGIKRSSGTFRKAPPGFKYDWSARRYVKEEA